MKTNFKRKNFNYYLVKKEIPEKQTLEVSLLIVIKTRT
jgi:hypothetical protein